MIEMKNRPYFGYMRGKYTKEDIRAIDGYAYDYGIEVIPCIECYGHMAKYLIWDEAADIKDTSSVLLAREEKTFEFLDELIENVSSSYAGFHSRSTQTFCGIPSTSSTPL